MDKSSCNAYQKHWIILLALLLVLTVNTLLQAHSKKLSNTQTMIFKPEWTQSYKLYKQPHAIWLSRYSHAGDNLPLLKQTLNAARKTHTIPEFVLYAIPLRDLGQSSEGGFKNYEDYLADSQLNAKVLGVFAHQTGMSPILYLEPDSLPLAIQYKRDTNDNTEAQHIYQQRVETFHKLITLYKSQGVKVYLEGGHSGWFDYSDADIQRIAQGLNEAGITEADGLATNVSNRQAIYGNPLQTPNTEWHYLSRLLPLLNNHHLDVRIDTSRNGGTTHARQYFLEGWQASQKRENHGPLWDNESLGGRRVGTWSSDTAGNLKFQAFFGTEKNIQRLIEKEKYQWHPEKGLLIAPAWLDPVGDVKPGLAPSDNPPASIAKVIQHYRYIKPPDDSDGALNYPAGASKAEINAKTALKQQKTPALEAYKSKIWE